MEIGPKYLECYIRMLMFYTTHLWCGDGLLLLTLLLRWNIMGRYWNYTEELGPQNLTQN